MEPQSLLKAAQPPPSSGANGSATITFEKFSYIRGRGVFCAKIRHSCEGRNPEKLRPATWMPVCAGMTGKTPRPLSYIEFEHQFF